MEQLIHFNGVYVLLTTAERLSEVQNFRDRADVIISVYPQRTVILATRPAAGYPPESAK